MSDRVVSLGDAFDRGFRAEAERTGRFRVRTLSEFRRPEIPKLVHGLIGHQHLVLVYGGWSAGKSFFVIDKACCIAFGDQWRGRACDPGAVVYVAGEAPGSIESRTRAWLLRRGKLAKGAQDPPIGVVGCAPNFLGGGDDLAELCEEIEAYGRVTGLPIRAIVVDTLHACAPGSREDAGDVGAVLANVRALMERFSCAVILVHHAGKESGRGARGSSSLEAAADIIIEVTEDGGVRTPIVRKARDGELPELEPFVIDSVIFGQGTPDPVRVGVHELTEPKLDAGDPRKGRAKTMRKAGTSFRTISMELGVPKSTVERWCKE